MKHLAIMIIIALPLLLPHQAKAGSFSRTMGVIQARLTADTSPAFRDRRQPGETVHFRNSAPTPAPKIRHGRYHRDHDRIHRNRHVPPAWYRHGRHDHSGYGRFQQPYRDRACGDRRPACVKTPGLRIIYRFPW